jgi:hypothetical protein
MRSSLFVALVALLLDDSSISAARHVLQPSSDHDAPSSSSSLSSSSSAPRLYQALFMNKRLANFLVGPRWRQFSSRIYAFKGVEYRSASLYGVGYSTGLLLVPSEGLRRGAESKHSWEASLRRDPRVVAVLTGDEFCGYPTHHARPASKLGRQQRQELLRRHVHLAGSFEPAQWRQPTLRNYWNDRGHGTVLLWPTTTTNQMMRSGGSNRSSSSSSSSSVAGSPPVPRVLAASQMDQDHLDRVNNNGEGHSSSTSALSSLSAAAAASADMALADTPRYLPLGPRGEFPIIPDEVREWTR